MSDVTAIAYLRVSTLEQESGFGFEIQERAVLKYCEEHGLPAPEMLRESLSGESLLKREEINLVLAKAEDAVEAGGEAHIIFYSLDRLSRDLIDQESVVTRCMDKGIRLHSAQPAETDVLDPAHAKDPMRTAIRQFFGIVAQLERAIIRRRLEAGTERKRMAGGFAGGRVPFGYRAVNGELQPDSDQAAAVRRCLWLVDKGLTRTTVAAILSAEFPCCAKWRTTQVSRCIDRRELYEQGMWKTASMPAPVNRPDLILVANAPVTEGQVSVNWDKIEYPLTVESVGFLLGMTAQDVYAYAVEAGFRIQHKKGKSYVGKGIVDALRRTSQKP